LSQKKLTAAEKEALSGAKLMFVRDTAQSKVDVANILARLKTQLAAQLRREQQIDDA